MAEQPPISEAGRARRRRGRVSVAMLTTGGVLFAAGLWIAVTALMANSQLNQARAEIHTLSAQLSASHWPAARATAADLATHAHRANQLTSGPVWALGAALPSGGEPLKTIRGITAGVHPLSPAVPPQLVNAGPRLDVRTLRRPDGSIALSRIAAVGPAVASAANVVAQTTKTISALPPHTWAGSIDAAYADALNQVAALNSSLKS